MENKTGRVVCKLKDADKFRIHSYLQKIDVPQYTLDLLVVMVRREVPDANVTKENLRSLIESSGLPKPKGAGRVHTGNPRRDRIVRLARIVRTLFAELGLPVPDDLSNLIANRGERGTDADSGLPQAPTQESKTPHETAADLKSRLDKVRSAEDRVANLREQCLKELEESRRKVAEVRAKRAAEAQEKMEETNGVQ